MVVTPLPDRPTLLPAPLTSLVGRTAEIAAVVALLRHPSVRLVTLTGPGGVGKTRLALQLAADLAREFADGVAFVPLAPVRDPALVLPTVAQELGIRAGSDRPLAVHLAAALRQRELLLVLDNLEQVLDAAPQVADLLVACPSLKVLVTSRAILRVSGEHDFPVPPLSLPVAGRSPTLEEFAGIEAIALFVERARAADPGFALTAANAAGIAAICERLDGLPLAIELAAVRITVLSPQALLARLTDRLRLLTGGGRDQPVRLRTMRDAVAWSYDLLSPEEQALFRRLAVFADGCTLEAAEAVCGGAGGDVLDGVTALKSQSLLRRIEPPEGLPRFGMLETVREYALDRLAAAGEEAEIRRRHATWCLAFAERAQEEVYGPAYGRCLDQLDAEQGNFRSALAWAMDQREFEFGLQLTAALWDYYFFRGQVSEARGWQARLLAQASDLSPLVRATALAMAGELARAAGDYAAAITQADESIAIARRAGDSMILARTLYLRSIAAENLDDYDLQVALAEEALALYRSIGAAHWIVEVLLDLGRAARKRADFAQAQAHHEEALALARERSDAWGIAWAATELAEVAADQGDTGCAAALYAESVQLHADHGDQLGVDLCLLRLAKIAGPGVRPGDATRLLGTAEVMRENRGSSLTPADRIWHDRYLADLRARLGEEEFAASYAAGRSLTLAETVVEALALAEAVASSPPAAGSAGPAADYGLTPRELEVWRLIAEGRSNQEIADALFISPRTAQTHTTRLFAKLGVSSRSAAGALAHRVGV